MGKITQTVLLCSTLHDPRGVFLDSFQEIAQTVCDSYAGWVINVTQTTDPRVKNEIRGLQNRIYYTETDTERTLASDKVENDHLYLLEQALLVARHNNLSKIQYTDGDRIIVAAKHFPEDFKNMAQLAEKETVDVKSYLNLRRTPEDYFSHHSPLVQTELEFNRLYTLAFGIPIDIGSTAHIFSRDVLEAIIKRSPGMEPISFPHPKWLMIAKGLGVKIKSKEVENVLTFETPEQFRKEVEDEVAKGDFQKLREVAGRAEVESLEVEDIRGSYNLIQQAYMVSLGLKSVTSPQEWEARFRIERQYLGLLKNNLPTISQDTDRNNMLLSDIDRTLVSMEGRRSVVLEALSGGKESQK